MNATASTVTPPGERTARELKREIVARAKRLGFDSCRIAAAASPRHSAEFRAWLRDGAAGEMDWLARGEEKRCEPQQVLMGVRSVIVVALSYWQGDQSTRAIQTKERRFPNRRRFSGDLEIAAP